MSLRVVVLALLSIALVDCYTLQPGQITFLPRQYVLPDDRYSFQRMINTNKFEIINCPEGFIFDADELRCSQMPSVRASFGGTVELNGLRSSCPADKNGVMPYQPNCRYFINCYYGAGTIFECPAHLLFNENAEYCDWPHDSNCCEYDANMRQSSK